jgi:uncharacterized protein YodC (DUF2158 family)
MAEQRVPDGTVVRLRSGGPKMTIVDFAKYGLGATTESYKCRWFDDKNKIVEDTFTEAELEREDQYSGGGRVLTGED